MDKGRLPFFSRAAAAYQRRFAARAVVLMYHRVAQPTADPWRLCVSVEHFASQMEMLANLGTEVVPLSSLPSRAQESHARKCVAITFDDGYQDNLVNAAPILGEASLPATLFVATGFIGSGQAFWWDRLATALLQPGNLPASIDLEIAGNRHHWELGEHARYTEAQAKPHRTWKARHRPPTRRHAVLQELWQALVCIDEGERDTVLQILEDMAGKDQQSDVFALPMSRQQLQDFKGITGLELGAHGHSHRSLRDLSDHELQNELTKSKAILEEIAGATVCAMSYPQGICDKRSGHAAAMAGFSIACTSESRAVTTRDQPLSLPRIMVPDISGAELAERLAYFMKPA